MLIFLWELINRTKRLLENPESSVLIVSLGYAAKLLGLFLRDDVLLEGVYGLLLKILDVQLALFLDFIQSKNRLNTTTFDGTRFKFSTPPFQGVSTYKISGGLRKSFIWLFHLNTLNCPMLRYTRILRALNIF